MIRAIVLLFFLSSIIGYSQNLKSHQWKERVVLIVSQKNSKIAKKQWNTLVENSKELKERKIIVYHILPNLLRTSENNLAIQNKDSYRRFKPKKGDFEITLFGLDGGIKLKRNELVDAKFLFNLIDSMPMRQSELKNKN